MNILPNLLVYSEKLIIFSDSVGASWRSRLQLTNTCAHDKIRNEGILRLSRPMAHYAVITLIKGVTHTINGFGDRAHLI